MEINSALIKGFHKKMPEEDQSVDDFISEFLSDSLDMTKVKDKNNAKKLALNLFIISWASELNKGDYLTPIYVPVYLRYLWSEFGVQ